MKAHKMFYESFVFLFDYCLRRSHHLNSYSELNVSKIGCQQNGADFYGAVTYSLLKSSCD